ncbi:MAG TPA: VWA domain-containing protein [Nocardioidaceae bacterium]|nr:VWA domain-containing protein [Nocardioidaceae bacterium]
MKFSTQLDVNVVAHEADDEVALLLDLAAPSAPATGEDRVGTSLQIVLDRSGSMAGAPLDGALKALAGLVQRLDARDNFGVVAFDNGVQVVVPAGPLTDKAEVLARLANVTAGGMTDLSGGYLRGLQELKRVAGDSGGTLLIISDGHVNGGVSDPDQLGALARDAYSKGIVTSTLGYGLGYDETLLTALTRGGSGNHHFAQDPDAAGAAIASEVTDLLAKAIQAASLTVQFSDAVELLRIYNDLPATQIGPGQVMVELGDFYFEEQRKLLMRLKVPAMAALGLAQIASLELRFVELPDLVEQVVTLPVTVNVVPGDEAAGRVPDASVQAEVLFQEAQQSKRLASEALERGDRKTAQRLLEEAVKTLGDAGDVAPLDLREDLRREAEEVRYMGEQSIVGDANVLSKRTRASYHMQNRKRGRRPSSGGEGS